MVSTCDVGKTWKPYKESYAFIEQDRLEIVGEVDGFAVLTDHAYQIVFRGRGDCNFYLMKIGPNWMHDPMTTCEYVAVLSVSKPFVSDKNNNRLQVDMIKIADGYRGKGLAPKFYEFIVDKLGIELISGFEQSIGGASIWQRMIERDNVNIKPVRWSWKTAKEKKFTQLRNIKLKVKKTANKLEWDTNAQEKQILGEYYVVFVASKKRKSKNAV